VDKHERSVHDNVINSYEVFCNRREIVFKTEYPHEPKEFTNVIFTGVVAYDFKHDSEFGSIIFDFEPWSPMAIYDENRQLIESGLPYGWPGPWAADRAQAEAYFAAQGINAWYLCASLGLTGWILAKSMIVVAAP
jgi:hypothetical protein